MSDISWFETYDIIFQLETPIPLTVTEYTIGDFYAENTTYSIIGIGDSEKEALEDARGNLGKCMSGSSKLSFLFLVIFQDGLR